MKSLKIVFMGSPDFAVPALKEIHASNHQVVGVVSQPDKPKGRGKKVLPTAVKNTALELGLSPILQPEKMRDEAFFTQLKVLNADVFVVVAFRILPQSIFSLPKISTINIHPSKLPKYRGAAPLNWTIINGDKQTAVSIIQISEKIDGGGILMQKDFDIAPDETAGELHDRLSVEGAKMLLQTLDLIAEDGITATAQDDAKATPAPKLFPDTCHLKFNLPAAKVKNKIHGLSPYPSAFAMLGGDKLKFYRAKLTGKSAGGTATGTIYSPDNQQVFVACEDELLEILELQRPGKKRMKAADFLRGNVFPEKSILK